MYLTQALHRSVQQEPEAPFAIFGHRTRTAAEFVDRIARLAGGLRAVGVQPGDRVAMLSLNSDRYLEYFAAAAWLGAVAHPLNVRWSTPEMVFALSESDTRVLFVDDTFAHLVDDLRRDFRGLQTVIAVTDGSVPENCLDYETLLAGHDPIDDTRTGGAAPAAIMYTGGTTGRSKGVLLSHDNVLAAAYGVAASATTISVGGRVLHVMPLFHVGGLALWWLATVVGSTHVVLPGFTAPTVLDAIGEHRITDTLLVPTMIQMLLEDPGLSGTDTTAIQHFIYGSAPISETLLRRARAAFPTAEFTQAYGMTELSATAALLAPADHDDPTLRRAVGRAAPHCEIKIVDTDAAEVIRGQVGEVVVRGDNVMLEYWRRPEQTAAILSGGWLHTGDAGYMDERGYVFLVDRIKDMIITGGENVYSVEVENAIMTHPGVVACAVIGVPDQQWGERVHAVVVLGPGVTVSAEDLQTHCRATIAGYKLPRSIDFVDTLPLSAAGKVLKQELRQRYRSADGDEASE